MGDKGGEENHCHVPSGGHSVTHVMYLVGDREERSVSAMYPVGDAQWLMYPVGDGGGEEDLCHVPSGGRSVAYVLSGG